MIQIRGLTFAWPGAPRPLLEIDELHVAAGETLFVHGESGCGKSTLLGLLAGVLVAGRGQVSLLGQDWANLSGAARDRHRAEHVGYVFQQFNLLPYLSVIDNVRLSCRFSARRAARAVDPTARAQELLTRIGLAEDHWTRRADALSVGQQQRVAAARALIGQPEVIIADEPTSALDAARRDDFMQLLLGECRAGGSALVFVSHDERLAAAFDRRSSLPALNRARSSNALPDAASPRR